MTYPRNKPYKAQVRIRSESYYIGYYATKEEREAARIKFLVSQGLPPDYNSPSNVSRRSAQTQRMLGIPGPCSGKSWSVNKEGKREYAIHQGK